MIETTCHFGTNASQFGVLSGCQQNVVQVEPRGPAVIMLNAGITHHIGPFRLHVDIARRLANLGVATLRMDLSGLGESRPRRGDLNPNENRAISDVRDAMDYLVDRTGIDTFVLVGLCSGAFNTHEVALNDDRVVGAVFLDGIVYPTAGYYFRHNLRRLFNFRAWRNSLKRRWLFGKQQSSATSFDESEFFVNPYSRQEVAGHLNTMLDRGMQMLFVYTDGYDDICDRRQFDEMFGLKPNHENLQVDYRPKSEHTFRIVENREKTCHRIVNWYGQRFGIDADRAD